MVAIAVSKASTRVLPLPCYRNMTLYTARRRVDLHLFFSSMAHFSDKLTPCLYKIGKFFFKTYPFDVMEIFFYIEA